ncbi:MAG: 50S ribosomal protein L29 [Clostridia bacterium]|nr:50S ribosomal protein L29 [Clostridia bacterium]
MKAREIHNMTNDELATKLVSLKEELFNLRFRHATGQLENPNVLKTVKKDIARVKTVIRERELKAN